MPYKSYDVNVDLSGLLKRGVSASIDWVEDFTHENGQYVRECIHCSGLFAGHKRRVVCKMCVKRERGEG